MARLGHPLRQTRRRLPRRRRTQGDHHLAALFVRHALVRFELLAGIRTKELTAFEEFCSALRWAEVSEDVARVAGQLARRYRKNHSGIGAVDYLIAATAIVIDADLLTTNVRYFPMFTRLRAPY